MEKITFREVEKKYNEAVHYLEVNDKLAFEKHPGKSAWIDDKVLAGWFYEASREWLNEFQKIAIKYAEQKGRIFLDEVGKISSDGSDLIERINSLAIKMNSKFGSN